MARVTIEDCKKFVDNNRFKLVVLASQRARDIGAGSPIMVRRDNDKDPVVALREIADSKINIPQLNSTVKFSLYRQANQIDQGISSKTDENKYKQLQESQNEGLGEEIMEDISEYMDIDSIIKEDASLFGMDDVDVID